MDTGGFYFENEGSGKDRTRYRDRGKTYEDLCVGIT